MWLGFVLSLAIECLLSDMRESVNKDNVNIRTSFINDPAS